VSLRVRHTAWFRGVAVILLVFCLLSCFRALVPGMCATLAAIQDETSVKPSCCSVGCLSENKGNGLPNVASSSRAHPDCAFCKLAHALVTVQSYFFVERPIFAALRQAKGPLPALICAAPRMAARPRDPPDNRTPI